MERQCAGDARLVSWMHDMQRVMIPTALTCSAQPYPSVEADDIAIYTKMDRRGAFSIGKRVRSWSFLSPLLKPHDFAVRR